MPITEKILAERLRRERNRVGLTQEEAAELLGVKRSTIVQIEAGNRDVTSIELSRIAVMYKRDVEFFLSESELDEPCGVMHLRAGTDIEDEPVRDNLEKCVKVCKAATALETMLGTSRIGVAFSYTLERPQTRWEAVEQGMRLAAMERKRLELGTIPVRNIVEIIAQHGVRVGRYTLTDDISGLFFVGSDTGMAILVNSGHSPTRRLFSYAHEYAHMLVDSAQVSGGVSRFGNRDDLLEVRANTFAAHFLMPDEGVRNFLDSISGPTRQVMEIYDGFKEQIGNHEEELVTAQRRTAPGSQEVRMIDVLRLARHFGTSYEATTYQLLNLKIIQREVMEKLLSDKDRSEKVNDLLGSALGRPSLYLERETMADLKQTLVSLVVEAWLQKQIPWPKACEYMQLVNVDPQLLEKLDNLKITA